MKSVPVEAGKSNPVFLNERRPLPEAVARHLVGSGEGRTWDDTLLILPTAETGRRVVDALLAGCGDEVIFPPRTVTPLSLIPFGTGEDVATALTARLAWARALEAAGGCVATFGADSTPESRRGLAESLVELTRTLASANLNIPDAAKRLGDRDPRWLEWVSLWEAYTAVLDSTGLKCPGEAQRQAARNFTLPEGIRHVLIAGVRDVPPLAWTALNRVDFTVLIHAPGIENPREAFDSRGIPLPEFWAAANIPIPDERICVVDGLADASAAAARIAAGTTDSVSIIAGDPTLAREISEALDDLGVSCFLPEGRALSAHPVATLAQMLALLGAGADWSAIEELLRHPDFLVWLKRDGLWSERLPEEWNAFGRAAMRPALDEIASRLGIGGTDPVRALARHLCKLAERMRSRNPARELRGILAEIYGPENLGERPGDADAAKALVQILDEILENPGLGIPDAAELASLVGSLSGSWNEAREMDSIPIEGWLELAGESSAAVILAGLNEGLLPSRRRNDPLLPDSARGLLGLDNDDSRLARDAAMLSAAVEVWGERLFVLSAQRAADEAPLKPSRLLLRVPDSALPVRTRYLCMELPGPEHSAAIDFRSAPLRIPVPTRKPASMNVTDFSAYLNCPLRYFLSTRLGMNAPATVSHRLENDTFGSWMHEVLNEFGSETRIRESSDSGEILAFVRSRWDARFEPFAGDVDLVLQREAGRMRLEQFAIHQAAVRRDGWRIRDVEWRIHEKDGLAIEGWPLALRGRIDRIDEKDGRLRLIDYKTGISGSSKPERLVRDAHLGKPGENAPEFALFGEEAWKNLQLPLYAIAVDAMAPSGAIDLAYFLLPDNPDKAGVFEWCADVAEIKSAAECARAVMREVADDAVLSWIEKGDFSRFAEAPAYDEFEAIALDRYLEAGALEVIR